MKRILAIDDDTELCSLLIDFMRMEGFACECAHHGDEGLRMLDAGGYDLVILDVMLPDRDGFDILRDIRDRSDIPVIMLTARGDHIDRVVGLEIGADDYICKPFNSRELTARVRAVLRRIDDGESMSPAGDVLRTEDLEIDLRSRTVTVGGRELVLSNIEFKLLEALVASVGEVVSSQALSAKALNRQYRASDRSLSVHMSNLRRKIGTHPTGNERILTVRGEGFVYVYAKQAAPES